MQDYFVEQVATFSGQFVIVPLLPRGASVVIRIIPNLLQEEARRIFSIVS